MIRNLQAIQIHPPALTRSTRRACAFNMSSRILLRCATNIAAAGHSRALVHRHGSTTSASSASAAALALPQLRHLSTTGSALQVCLSADVTASITKAATMANKKYTIAEVGTPNSSNYRVFLKNEAGELVSPLHDIPLFANDAKTVYNMVVEVPRWTNAKMEISLADPLNPIKQDIKKGKLRFVANVFPHHGYIWNYGALPQTWENPEHLDAATGCKGDNDPIDAVEIGSRIASRGEVVQVKILGTLALIDEGETDWKLIVIDVNDPLAAELNDVGDVEKRLPGLLKATVEWFKIYKIPDGKPENQFAFNGEAKNAAFATNVVAETHAFWRSLVSKEVQSDKISCATVTVPDSPYAISAEEAQKHFEESPSGGEAEDVSSVVLDKWHYVQLEHVK